MTTATRQTNQAGMISQAAERGTGSGKKTEALKDWVQIMLPQISKALPSVITPERFTRMVLTALSSNAQLASCTRDSFLGGMMQAAQLGLEPNTPLGQAYLIPYRNNRKEVIECQFQIGYKGLIDLCYRSGEVATVRAYCVYENDEFEYELGLEPVLKHKPARTNRGDMVYVYAVLKLVNGGFGFEVMSVEDVRKHRDRYSKAAARGSSPWESNFEEMAKKTVLKKVLKYAPLKSDFARGVAADGGTSTVNIEEEAPQIEVAYEAMAEDIEIDGQTVAVNLKTGEMVEG